MSDFNKFTQLLKANDYIAIEYFSYNNYCKLVKIVHLISGKLFYLQISKQYKLAIPTDVPNNYNIMRENSNSKEFNSSYLTDYYPMIRLEQKGDQIVDNIADKLTSNYKQPISLSKNSTTEYVEQLKRLKYCFKTLEYKVILQTCKNLLLLNMENNIEVYEIDHYPIHKIKTFYPLVGLEQFYTKIQVIHDIIKEIDNEFYCILDINQQKHNEHLTTKFVDNFITNNDKLLSTKKRLHDIHNDICSVLIDIHNKENRQLELINNQTKNKSYNIYEDANISRHKEELRNSYDKIHDTKIKIIEKIIKLDDKIKNIYLIIDQLGFNLSVSLNELRNELNDIL